MLVEIITIDTGTANGTLGQLFINQKPFCKTIEREWKDNEKNISCIPPGRYKLIPHVSPSMGRVIALVGLDNQGVTLHGPSQRTHIYIHAANRADELLGCIAVGSCIVDGIAVYDSKNTLAKLIAKLGRVEHELVIKRF